MDVWDATNGAPTQVQRAVTELGPRRARRGKGAEPRWLQPERGGAGSSGPSPWLQEGDPDPETLGRSSKAAVFRVPIKVQEPQQPRPSSLIHTVVEQETEAGSLHFLPSASGNVNPAIQPREGCGATGPPGTPLPDY